MEIVDKNGVPYKPAKKEATSFIRPLQLHTIKLKGKIEQLKVLHKALTGFTSSTEYEAVCQMTAISQMQLEAGIRALTFS